MALVVLWPTQAQAGAGDPHHLQDRWPDRWQDRWQDRWEHLGRRPPNQLLMDALTIGDFAGIGLGYRRGLGRHFSLGAIFEYAYPNPGYAQLIGFGHTLQAAVWIKRPWTGMFFVAHLTVGHQFSVTLPELRNVSFGGGAEVGWSWDMTNHLNVAFSGGLRRVAVLEASTQICTLPNQCIYSEPGFKPRFTLSFGYRF